MKYMATVDENSSPCPGCFFSKAFISVIESFVDIMQEHPELLNDPQLEFFRDYLDSFNCTMPPKPPVTTTTAAPTPAETTVKVTTPEGGEGILPGTWPPWWETSTEEPMTEEPTEWDWFTTEEPLINTTSAPRPTTSTSESKWLYVFICLCIHRCVCIIFLSSSCGPDHCCAQHNDRAPADISLQHQHPLHPHRYV